MTISEVSLSLRDELRRQTRDAHERVDALYGTCDLAVEGDYSRFLRAQATAWQTLRPVLDPGSTARLTALLGDLAVLGEAAPEPLEANDLPAPSSLGLRYVLEGSRLGSTVMLRSLQAEAPALAERAGRYFTVSAELDAWRQLSTALQIQARNDDEAAATIADARCVFGLFERAWRVTEEDDMKKSKAL